MKNYYKSIKANLIIILLLGVFSTNAAVFHSTSAGGNWNNTATWQEAAVPTATDDVIITGPGIVYINTNAECNNLTINSGAILRNPDWTTVSLTVNGDIINNGTFTKGNNQLTVYFYGNIVNNGTWTFNIAHLSGAATQQISLSAGQEFACGQFINDDPFSPAQALTDLTFNGTTIDFNNGQLIMPVGGGGKLSLYNCDLVETDLITNSGILEMDLNSLILSNCVIHNATLQGLVIIGADPVTFEGETVNNGTLKNAQWTYVYWCYIDGNITNNGTIQNSNSPFYLRCNGNITNNGVWSNHYTEMMSYNTHELYQGETGMFSGLNFAAADTTGTITVMTDFDFSGTQINLNGVTMELDQSKGANLSVLDKWLYNGNFEANGQDLYMDNNAFLQDITVENATLKGVVKINENGVVFDGNTIVEGTLKTRDWVTSTITINDLLTNNGTIENSNNHLYLNINGNLINNGTISNTTITMTGTSDQFISCLNGNSIGTQNFNDSDNSSKVILAGKTSFSGTNLDLSGGRIDCAGYELEFINNAKVNNTEIEDAVLTGTIYIDNNNVHFYGLTVNKGTLRNYDWEIISTYVHGDLINDSTIKKSNQNFNIYFYGDITNNGVWTFSETHFASTATQYITLTSGHEFACAGFINDDPSSPVEALTDLSFSGTQINFNNGQLIMPASKGGMITLHGGYLYQIDLITNSGTLELDGGAVIWDQSVINNATLKGTVIIRADTVTFSGETVNNGTLRNNNDVDIYWCYIDGNITNNGTIQNSNHPFYIRCNGNITNNGVWSNRYTEMMSYNTHELYQGGTGMFSGLNFAAADTTGTITVMTDFDFSGTQINLNGVTMELDQSKGANLSVLDKWLYNGNFEANGQDLYMDNNAFLQDITVENATLKGVVKINENGVVFDGNTIVEGTLKTRDWVTSTITINDLLTNNGTIENSNNTLYLNINGNLINNGTISNTTITMTGTSDQFISCLNGNSIGTQNFNDSDNSSKVILAGKTSFSGTNIDLSGGRIDCAGYELEFINNAKVNNTEIEDAVLTGTIYIDNNNVHFYGRTVNNGTFRNYNWDIITTYIHGDIYNNETIMKSNSDFYIECEGDIVNNGSWTNNRTTLKGTGDQTIYLINNQEITGNVYFNALNAGAPYQWYFNGSVLNSADFNGETTNELSWLVPVSETWYGDFYCQTGAGPSRTITVSGGIIMDIRVILEGAYNGIDMNTTLNENNKIPLTQPYNTAPWNYNGTESVAAIPAGVVDWVLVELRETSGDPETATPGTMIMQRALFLNSDGEVVDLQGNREIKFDIPTVYDNLYMIVWHRNHLGVMTANPVSLDTAPILYDFSAAEGNAYGNSDGHKNLGGGVFGMYAGDANSDGDINNNDKVTWSLNAGTKGYKSADLNLDTQIDNKDKNEIWVENINKQTQVPD